MVLQMSRGLWPEAGFYPLASHTLTNAAQLSHETMKPHVKNELNEGNTDVT